MVCMKMVSLALLARAKGVSPTGEKHPASAALSLRLAELVGLETAG
jgi:hypothetical protein